MNRKYVIVDIHPEDAFYDKRDELLGRLLTPGVYWHQSKVDGEYMAGGATMDNRFPFLQNGNYIYFLAVMVITEEEAMKS